MAGPCGSCAESQHSRLAGLDFQVEGSQAFRQFPAKAIRLVLVLEADDEVIAVAHQVRFAATGLREAPLEPQVQHIMKVDVRQYR